MSELPPSEEPGLQVGKVCLHVSPHAFNGKTPLCLQSHDELLKDNEELHADVTVRSSILICEHRHVRCVDVYIAALPLQELENLLADAQAEIEQLRGRLDDQEGQLPQLLHFPPQCPAQHLPFQLGVDRGHGLHRKDGRGYVLFCSRGTPAAVAEHPANAIGGDGAPSSEPACRQ